MTRSRLGVFGRSPSVMMAAIVLSLRECAAIRRPATVGFRLCMHTHATTRMRQPDGVLRSMKGAAQHEAVDRGRL